jgi:hypothetical protein
MNATPPVITTMVRNVTTGAWTLVVPSPNGTSLTGTTGSIMDPAGNVWTLSSTGLIVVNGVPDLSTWGVKELLYLDGVIWQFNGSEWYTKSVPQWVEEPSTPLEALLSWTPPTTNADGTPITGLTGYVISYGTSAAALARTVAVGLVSSHIFAGLAAGTWYFSIKAVNRFNVDSAPSAVVSKVIT